MKEDKEASPIGMDDAPYLTFPCRRKGARCRGMEEYDLAQATQILKQLTPRELEILKRLPTGESDKQIAQCLNLSKKTVQHHIGVLLTKTGTKNRTQAAIKALRMGLDDMPNL